MAQSYREVKVITGNFARVNIFPVRTYQIGRKAKNKPTAAAQDRLNREMRRRKLSDLINLNFTKKDIQLKLDYYAFRQEHGRNPEPDEVVKIMRNFMRRLKRLYERFGVELKYIYCSEIGARGHISHHHVIINGGVDIELIKALWIDGGVWWRHLFFDRRGCYDLASYFVKDRYTYRSYTCSKNLKRPQESGRDKNIYKNDHTVRQKQVNAMMNGEIEDIRRMYPGWEIAELPDVSYTVDRVTGEAKLPTWGIFIMLFLYKPEGLSDRASEWDKRGKYIGGLYEDRKDRI